MSRLLSLDDPGALDAERVGVKAARLAHARRLGFRVLPGLIVPATESERAMRRGQSALEERGAGAARVAVGMVELDRDLLDELAAAERLGSTLVVRSSTRLDGDGKWSGAFASTHHVAPAEIPAAVVGCWASAFSPDAIARFEQTERQPQSAGLAVLVQDQLTPMAGGWARISGDQVEIAAISGSPAQLLAGWERGWRGVVRPDGVMDGDPTPGPLELGQLRELGELARRASRELGVDRMEWAVSGDAIVILQLDRAPAPGPSALAAVPEALGAVPYERMARMLIGRSGRLADRLIAPWAAASPGTIHPARVSGPPETLFQDAKRFAMDLGGAVAGSLGLTSQELLGLLDVGDPVVAERLANVTIDAEQAAYVLGALDAVGESLAARHILRAPEELWWQTVEWVDAALSSDAPAPGAGWVADRWGHLIYGATVRRGRRISGTSGCAGWAVGRATFLAHPDDVTSFRGRDVLVVQHPLPSFAPLLWRASGLVSLTGSPAAHLCEVARSLRLPTVVSADVHPLAEGLVLGIDGSSGDVWHWAATGPEVPSSPA
jgi:phosphohistidine swiveling domain-containing protein